MHAVYARRQFGPAARTVNEADFPTFGPPADKLRFLLRYAVLAPSPYNTQPWRFGIRNDCVDLFADRTHALRAADPLGRELMISCGAALFNLQLAAHHFNLRMKVREFPDAADPDRVAQASLSAGGYPAADDRLLFLAIAARRTHNGPFDATRPSPSTLAELQSEVGREGAQLVYIEDPVQVAEVAELVSLGERAHLTEPNLQAERVRWTRHGGLENSDGVPQDHLESSCELPEFGAPEWSQHIGATDLKAFRIAHVKRLAATSPVLALISTEEDRPVDWLGAGRALERVLLRARVAGLWSGYLNQPMRIPVLRHRLRRALHSGPFPQVLLHMGFGAEPRTTPRRALEQMLSP